MYISEGVANDEERHGDSNEKIKDRETIPLYLTLARRALARDRSYP